MANSRAPETNSSLFGEEVPLDQTTSIRTVGKSAAENRGRRPPEGSGVVVGSGAGAGGGGAEDPDTDIQSGSLNATGMNGVG